MSYILPGYAPGFFFCIQTRDGEILVPELPDVDAVLADNSARTKNVLADARLQNAIQSSIEANVQIHPGSVQAALTQGMTSLTQIEARIKTDSGNVNHMGIDISASHNAYMDFSTQKGTIADTAKEARLGTAAQALMEDIGQALTSGQLSESEVAQLQNVMEGLTGDAELAAEYFGINLHDGGALGTEIGATKQTYVDSENGVGDNGVDGLATFKYFKDEQLKTEPNKAYFWSGNSNGVGGMNKAAEIALQNGGATLEILLDEQGIKLPKWEFNNPVAIKAWKDASAIYARQASGEVRAIIGSKVNPDGVWITIELPILKANPNVIKIIIIDPESLVETNIFTR